MSSIEKRKTIDTIYFDFDETITKKSTTDLLLKLARDTYPNQRVFDRKLKEISTEYYSEHHAYLKELYGLKKADKEKIHGIYEKIRTHDKQSIDKLSESLIFKGINKSELYSLAKKVKIKKDAKDTIVKIRANTTILSANWCNTMIYQAFGKYCDNNISSDFEFKDDISTGKIIQNISSGMDKYDYYVKTKSASNAYVGDGINDLLCIMEAELPMYMNPDKKLKKLMKKLNVKVDYVKNWYEVDQLLR